MKALKDLSDKVSDFADKRGLANPAEVINEALGGETREESKKRREEAKKETPAPVKKANGGMVPGQGGAAPMPMKKGGKVSSASKRADGCCIRGKTRA
jgi:hypothetical protein